MVGWGLFTASRGTLMFQCLQKKKGGLRRQGRARVRFSIDVPPAPDVQAVPQAQ